MKTLVLAHYYTTPEVQQMADFVGDSLELSLRAQESNAERIVFAGVKFMAETAKILNPNAEVILPNPASTCSLVTQSETKGMHNLEFILKLFHNAATRPTIVTYINSSYQVKALSDIIVTSANVEDIVTNLIESGEEVYFTPDRNMGAYLRSQNPEWGDKFTYYDKAVCEVHDQFKADELKNLPWTNYGTYILAHPESPLPVLEQANLVGSTRKMLNYVENFLHKFGRIIVATEDGLLNNMREARPELDIQLAPTYSGCQCNSCPYMKMNSVQAVELAIQGIGGLVIDYIPEDARLKALKPIKRMMEWQQE